MASRADPAGSLVIGGAQCEGEGQPAAGQVGGTSAAIGAVHTSQRVAGGKQFSCHVECGCSPVRFAAPNHLHQRLGTSLRVGHLGEVCARLVLVLCEVQDLCKWMGIPKEGGCMCRL